MRTVHTFKFYSFEDGTFKSKSKAKKKGKVKTSPNFNLYSITPFVMLDPVICILGAGILSIAILEKILEHQGHYALAETLHMCFNIVIPCVAFGFIWKLMLSAGELFL
ncbi:hypothetical protein SC499_26105 [Peribacillus simplex]|nr:hypothetical protein [Peribacillus simplex]